VSTRGHEGNNRRRGSSKSENRRVKEGEESGGVCGRLKKGEKRKGGLFEGIGQDRPLWMTGKCLKRDDRGNDNKKGKAWLGLTSGGSRVTRNSHTDKEGN